MRSAQRPLGRRWCLGITLGTALVSLLGCGASPQLTAHWRDHQLVVDGKLDDWAGWQTTVAATGARVGVANDGEALFISLETTDPALARLIAHRGLTVWFDAAATSRQTLGVRFPLPAAGPPSRWGEVGGSRPGGAQLDNLELLGPQPYTRHQIAAPGVGGVEVAIGGGPGVVTYELRVPLAAAAGAWGLGVAPGARLGIGLESRGSRGAPLRRGREAEGDGRGGPDGGGSPGDDDPGGGGSPDEGPPAGPGQGGGFRGGPGGRGGGAVRDFESWAVVRLAPPPG